MIPRRFVDVNVEGLQILFSNSYFSQLQRQAQGSAGYELHYQHLEPFAEIQRALLMVEVFELPQPELGSLLSVCKSLEHFCDD